MNQYFENYIKVTLPSSDLRALGREALRGKWKLAIFATLIFYVLTTLPPVMFDYFFPTIDGTSAFSGLYSILVTGPFLLGYYMFIMNIFRNKPANAGQVFSGFENFGKALGLNLFMTLFIVLWALLLIVPGIIAAIRYSQAFYVLADNPNFTIRECMNESKRMMQGNKAKYFWMQLSFIGWAILASIPAGIVTTVVETRNIIASGEAEVLAGGDLLAYNIVIFICELAIVVLMPYMQSTSIALYEIIKGNLRPGTIPADGYVEDESNPFINPNA